MSGPFRAPEDPLSERMRAVSSRGPPREPGHCRRGSRPSWRESRVRSPLVAARPVGGYHARSQPALFDPIRAARGARHHQRTPRHQWTWSSPSTHVMPTARRTSACAAPASCLASSSARARPRPRSRSTRKVFETLYRQAGRTSVVNMRLPGPGHDRERHHQERPAQPTERQRHPRRLLPRQPQDARWRSTSPSCSRRGARRRGNRGTLLHNLSSLHVKALPNDIPHEISVDVSGAGHLDAAIHVSDLDLNRERPDPDRWRDASFGRGAAARRGRRRSRGPRRGSGEEPPRPPRARAPRARAPRVAKIVPAGAQMVARARASPRPDPARLTAATPRSRLRCTSARIASTSGSRM